MVDYISTQAVSAALRLSVMQMQTQLATDQQEVTSGQVADVGLALGSQAGQTVSLEQQQARLQSITNTNAVITTRLSTTQAALTSAQTDAQNFLNALVGSSTETTTGAQTLQAQATTSLQSLISTLNTTSDGEYIFGGINTDTPPVANYFADPPGAAAQAVDSAFSTAFGMSQTSSGVSGITASAMQSFLGSTFASQFQGTSWTSNWSSASSQNILSRVSTNQLVDTSVNANDPAIQQLTEAYTMVSDLGIQNMSTGAAQAVISTATQLATQAISGLVTMQSSVGEAQQSISNANDTMSLQTNVLTTQLNNLVSVDPYTATTNVSNLTTQIETAYSLTAQLQKLNLVQYL